MAANHTVVLGGGISGLSAAFHLSRRFPRTPLTLLEKSSTVGGWIRSERVKLSSGSSIVLEAGPRTLRPSGKGLMELIHLLGLTSQMLTTSKDSPAARIRYLHLPPNPGLVALPSSLFGAFTSPGPLRGLLVPAILREALRAPNRPSHGHSSPKAWKMDHVNECDDESVHSLLSRRFGEDFARVFGSSLVHGIYAADSGRLSARTAFGSVWEMERRGAGSIVRGAVKEAVFGGGKDNKQMEMYQLGEVEDRLKGVSVFSFRDGVETITKALRDWLIAREGVRLRGTVGVRRMNYNRHEHVFEIQTDTNEILNPTHVVSALPLPALSSILCDTHIQLPHLTANPMSSVTVVNLIFTTTPSVRIHPEGYGYLIPRPATGYLAEEVDGILGCVFDSCAVAGQDAGPPVTKLSVMLGGPYPHRQPSIPFILACLQHHLGLPAPLPEPVFSRIHEHKSCIPVPCVGHLDRVEELRKALSRGGLEGRMEVVGAGVDGVSVSDCVESGRRAGATWNLP